MVIREADVVRAVKAYFEDAGFSCTQGDPEDLLCVSADQSERWVIEAKGETSEPGTDFQTGLGQLLMGMREPYWRYAIAIPHTPRYLRQCNKLPVWVREKLGVVLLLVQVDGQVTKIGPSEPISGS